MNQWSAAEISAATILVLCGIGGSIAAIVTTIETFIPVRRHRKRPAGHPSNGVKMIEQLNMTDIPITRVGDKDTSREAASVLRCALGDLRFQVWRTLARAGESGLADFELRAACEAAMGRRPESTYRKRRSELSAMGLAIETGHRRLNANGRAEAVHRARTLDEMREMISHISSLDKAGRKAWVAENKQAKPVQEAAE